MSALMKDREMRAMLDVVAADGPAPLIRSATPAEPYPINHVHASCPLIADAICDIATAAQADVAVAAGATLSAAALLAQSFVDVAIDSRTYPCSLFVLTVALSGERKSEADGLALRAVSEHERRELARFRAQPEGRRNPRMLDSDPTLEGLFRSFDNGMPSRLIACADGGLFVGGHAMSRDQRLKSSAGLTLAWDGKPMARTRATDREEKTYYGRRVSMHLQGQPAAIGSFVNDPALRGQGLLGRCLLAIPAPVMGRTYASVDHATLPGLAAFRKWQMQMLEQRMPFKIFDDEETDELDPRAIRFSCPTVRLFAQAYDAAQRAIEPRGQWASIREYGARMPEHAGRLAGIFAFVSGSTEVEPHHLRGAIAVAQWHASEWLRAVDATAVDAHMEAASDLLDWLRRHGSTVHTLKGVYRNGPRSLRSVDRARSAVHTLVEYGHVRWVDTGSTFELRAP